MLVSIQAGSLPRLALSVVPYCAEHRRRWDDFVSRSRNGTFQFYRGYIEYRGDQLQDLSLLVFRGDQLLAILPAAVTGPSVSSHSGLSFGGLLVGANVSAATIDHCWRVILDYYASAGLKSFCYRALPSIYWRGIAGEDACILYLLGARLTGRKLGAVVDLSAGLPYGKRRSRQIARAERTGIVVKRAVSFDRYWNSILVPLLDRKYGVTPVHTLAEIKLLAERFPENILLFEALRDGNVIAGSVAYVYDQVVHTQYLATSDEGADHGGLDLVIDFIVKNFRHSHRFLSLGTSNDPETLAPAWSLFGWKEGFGARAFPQDTYTLDLSS